MYGLRRPDPPAQDPLTVARQIEAYDRNRQASAEWARMAKTCVDFFEGAQWTPEEIAELGLQGRVAGKWNYIRPMVRVIKGYQRQNRYDITFMPGTDGVGTQQVADSLNQVNKQVSITNQSQWNDAEVFSDGLLGGRGYLDLTLDFQKNILGQIHERVCDPFAVFPDADGDTYDPATWADVVESSWMAPWQILLSYGDEAAKQAVTAAYEAAPAYASSFGITTGGTRTAWDEIKPDTTFGLSEFFKYDSGHTISLPSMSGGVAIGEHIDPSRRLIRVLHRQARSLTRVRWFIDLETGDKSVIPSVWSREKIQKVLAFAEQAGNPLTIMEGYDWRIRWTVTAGDKLLWDRWSPYRTVSYVPFFAYFRRGKTQGMVEDLLDPQREINKRRSVILHVLGTTANSGWTHEEGSLDPDVEEMLEEEGSRPGIVIRHKKGTNPPKRIEPGAFPEAVYKAEQIAKEDMKHIAGINDSALGHIDRVQSGKAIESRQRQAIVGAEEYFDNYSRTRFLKGRKILELIQDHYTEERLIRIRGEDGADQVTMINQRLADGQILNDVTLGTYNVVIDEAPASKTFLQGQFQEALEMREKGVPVPDKVLIKLSSLPGKDEILGEMEQAALAQAQAAAAAAAPQPVPAAAPAPLPGGPEVRPLPMPAGVGPLGAPGD